MPEHTVSRRLADFVSQLTYEDLSKEQVDRIKAYFLDWLGSAYAGQSQEPIRILLEVVKPMGGTPESTLIPRGSKGMCLLAALINGASSHVVEMDDLHRASIFHPAAAIMPAVFAAAERRHASGRDLIVSIAAGYEVGIRIALAAGPSHYEHWHTTATCGTFGAAAGSAKVLGLGPEQVRWSLGSAGTQASGLWEFLSDGAMSKQLHAGKAALNGLLATLLAEKGFTGAQHILEGEKGFFRATSSDFDETKCLNGLGKEFMLERNSLKYHASCGHTHSAIDAVLEATGATAMSPREIRTVGVRVYRECLDLLEKVAAESPYAAKFSIPFCVATAVRYGQVGITDFTESRLQDPEIADLMQKIQVKGDWRLSRYYPARWPARVTIHTRSGDRLEGACDFPKGDPENPLSGEELIRKFNALTEGILSQDASKALVERAMTLETCPSVDRLLENSS